MAGLAFPLALVCLWGVKDAYGFAASVYDTATWMWSGGAIWRSRACQWEAMLGGQRALYVGAGRGRAAVGAARRGLLVTGLDLSPAMLERARQHAQEEGLRVEWIQADASHWEPRQPFDHVCANHFLNVFDAERMPAMRERLWSWVAPGGYLHIADFRPLHGPWIARQAQRLHHWIPLSGCHALTGNARHPIYDHDVWKPSTQAPGNPPLSVDHRVWRIGPAWYRTWRFRKPQTEPAAPKRSR